jgi:prevent-host-death family protein
MSFATFDRNASPTAKGLGIIELVLGILQRRMTAADVSHDITPITTFRANYATLLDRASAGHVQTISRGKERFVLLSMDQIALLVMPPTDKRTLGELFHGLPTVPMSMALEAAPFEGEAQALDQYDLPEGVIAR